MGIRAFTDVKSMTEYWLPMKKEMHWYPMWSNMDLILEDLTSFLYSKELIKRALSMASATRRLLETVLHRV